MLSHILLQIVAIFTVASALAIPSYPPPSHNSLAARGKQSGNRVNIGVANRVSIYMGPNGLRMIHPTSIDDIDFTVFDTYINTIVSDIINEIDRRLGRYEDFMSANNWSLSPVKVRYMKNTKTQIFVAIDGIIPGVTPEVTTDITDTAVEIAWQRSLHVAAREELSKRLKRVWERSFRCDTKVYGRNSDQFPDVQQIARKDVEGWPKPWSTFRQSSLLKLLPVFFDEDSVGDDTDMKEDEGAKKEEEDAKKEEEDAKKEEEDAKKEEEDAKKEKEDAKKEKDKVYIKPEPLSDDAESFGVPYFGTSDVKDFNLPTDSSKDRHATPRAAPAESSPSLSVPSPLPIRADNNTLLPPGSNVLPRAQLEKAMDLPSEKAVSSPSKRIDHNPEASLSDKNMARAYDGINGSRMDDKHRLSRRAPPQKIHHSDSNSLYKNIYVAANGIRLVTTADGQALVDINRDDPEFRQAWASWVRTFVHAIRNDLLRYRGVEDLVTWFQWSVWPVQGTDNSNKDFLMVAVEAMIPPGEEERPLSEYERLLLGNAWRSWYKRVMNHSPMLYGGGNDPISDIRDVAPVFRDGDIVQGYLLRDLESDRPTWEAPPDVQAVENPPSITPAPPANEQVQANKGTITICVGSNGFRMLTPYKAKRWFINQELGAMTLWSNSVDQLSYELNKFSMDFTVEMTPERLGYADLSRRFVWEISQAMRSGVMIVSLDLVWARERNTIRDFQGSSRGYGFALATVEFPSREEPRSICARALISAWEREGYQVDVKGYSSSVESIASFPDARYLKLDDFYIPWERRQQQ